MTLADDPIAGATFIGGTALVRTYLDLDGVPVSEEIDLLTSDVRGVQTAAGAAAVRVPACRE